MCNSKYLLIPKQKIINIINDMIKNEFLQKLH